MDPTFSPTTAWTDSEDSTNFTNVERVIVIFILIGIACGNLTGYCLSSLPLAIPYHVLVFVEGVIIAIVLKHAFATGKTFERVICEPSVSSDLVLYVLLPVLLFKETMNMNWHHVISGFSQYMLLAGPGAIIFGLTCGVLAYYILDYSWSWQISFLFGAILSTTDPLSIVALLKKLGASNKLATVIVGESIFNDGSAMLLYFFFSNQQSYLSHPIRLISLVLRMIFASPLLGIAFGYVSYRLMRLFDSIINPHIDIQVAMTIGCAYLSFYVAEGPCRMSGVLSCASAGLMIAWLGSPKILDDEKMKIVWETLEWFCNTIIFFLAGLIAGSKGIAASSGSFGKDFAMIFVMYFIVNLIRVLMVLSFYPILRNMGFKLSLKEVTFIAFSGLRGALGICLSLVVESKYDDASNFFFLFTGITALTLLINSSLAIVVIQHLRLVEDPKAKKSSSMIRMLRRIKRMIRDRVHNELDHMKDELGDYNIDEVNKRCRILRGSHDVGDVFIPSSLFNKKLSSSKLNSLPEELHDDVDEIAFDEKNIPSSISIDLLSFTRTTFLDTLHARYWNSIRIGKLGVQAYSAKLLLYSVDVALDYVRDERVDLMDWKCIEEGLSRKSWNHQLFLFLDNLAEMLFGCYPGLVAYDDAKRERKAIYTLLNFIDAHSFAQKQLLDLLGEDSHEEMLVLKNSAESVTKAKIWLERIPQEDIQMLHTSRAARVAIVKQLEIVDQMIKYGTLSEKSAKLIYEAIDDDKQQLDRERNSMHRYTPLPLILLSIN
jgi:NhaP-type Na+/H+ or K+/H+ antiporter